MDVTLAVALGGDCLATPAALAPTVTTTSTTVQAPDPPAASTVRTAVAADPGGYAQVFTAVRLARHRRCGKYTGAAAE
ncbi:hypothetical protein [Streptomyces sp. NPDC058739]|uniref:hypothetical protein n=1 Tax=Streptomyces sp. NPDC058739 TaxID=3346618 RepID=UPI00367BBE81